MLSPIFTAHGRVFSREGLVGCDAHFSSSRLFCTGKIHHLQGEGFWGIEVNGTLTPGKGGTGLGVEDFHFPGGVRMFFLERFDLERDFEISSRNHSKCASRTSTGSMRNPWAWIATATFDGTRGHGNHIVDIWNNTFVGKRGVVDVAVGVSASDTTRPRFFFQRFKGNGVDRETLIELDEWDTKAPNSRLFQVPKECSRRY